MRAFGLQFSMSTANNSDNLLLEGMGKHSLDLGMITPKKIVYLSSTTYFHEAIKAIPCSPMTLIMMYHIGRFSSRSFQ